MQNPWKELSVKEWWLWSISMLIVTVSNLVGGSFDVLTLAATWVGITSLIFAAKGNVWAQFLMIAFSILYGIISFRFRYWGEMITYLGMTLPMAVWSAVTWLRNPSAGSKSEVAIRKLEKKHFLFLLVLSIVGSKRRTSYSARCPSPPVSWRHPSPCCAHPTMRWAMRQTIWC